MLQREAPLCGTVPEPRVDPVLVFSLSDCLSGQLHAEEGLGAEGLGVQAQAVTPDSNWEWQQPMMT